MNMISGLAKVQRLLVDNKPFYPTKTTATKI